MRKPDETEELLYKLVAALEAELDIDQRMAKGQSFVLGANGAFLGRITSPEHPESILNADGPFGGRYGEFSMFNRTGVYGAAEGDLSACSPAAKRPPLLFVGGEFWGVISPNGWPDGRAVSLERLLAMLRKDWRSIERGDLSDSGSIQTRAAK